MSVRERTGSMEKRHSKKKRVKLELKTSKFWDYGVLKYSYWFCLINITGWIELKPERPKFSTRTFRRAQTRARTWNFLLHLVYSNGEGDETKRYLNTLIL